MELWTGKQLFSVLVRPNAKTRVFVNLVVTEKNYNKKADIGSMCPTDGYVCFRNSELLCGQLGKATLGGYSLALEILSLLKSRFGFPICISLGTCLMMYKGSNKSSSSVY